MFNVGGSTEISMIRAVLTILLQMPSCKSPGQKPRGALLTFHWRSQQTCKLWESRTGCSVVKEPGMEGYNGQGFQTLDSHEPPLIYMGDIISVVLTLGMPAHL